jgi:hypothetical protein
VIFAHIVYRWNRNFQAVPRHHHTQSVARYALMLSRIGRPL